MFNLDRFVTHCMFKVPSWLEPFIAEFDRPDYSDESIVKKKEAGRDVRTDEKHSRRILITNRLAWEQPEVLRMIDDLDIYQDLDELKQLLNYFLARELINSRLFNKTFSLAVLLPHITEELRNQKIDVIEYNKSKKFLKYAIGEEVSSKYFIYLAVILMTESEHALTKFMTKEDRRKAEQDLIGMNKLFKVAHSVLYPIARASEEIEEEAVLKEIKVNPADIYISGEKSYPIKFFSTDGNAKSIVILGDGGSGKTFATLRIIWSALQQKYSVIILANDEAGEFRYCSNPLTHYSNQTLFNNLKKNQKEEPQPLPITIFTKNPTLQCEKDIKKFTGSITQWKELTRTPQVLMFQTDFTKIISSLEKWRSRDPATKVILVLNEAHELVANFLMKGRDWKMSVDFNKFLVRARSQFVPIILNTRHVALLTGMSISNVDEMYVSYFTKPQQRDRIVKIFPDFAESLKKYLSNPKLKKDKIFVRVAGEYIALTRFLIPPCMLKNPNYIIDKRAFKRVQ